MVVLNEAASVNKAIGHYPSSRSARMSSVREPGIFARACRTVSSETESSACDAQYARKPSSKRASSAAPPLSTVRRTCSCSRQETGSKGRKAPFSYTASSVRVIGSVLRQYHTSRVRPVQRRDRWHTEGKRALILSQPTPGKGKALFPRELFSTKTRPQEKAAR